MAVQYNNTTTYSLQHFSKQRSQSASQYKHLTKMWKRNDSVSVYRMYTFTTKYIAHTDVGRTVAAEYKIVKYCFAPTASQTDFNFPGEFLAGIY